MSVIQSMPPKAQVIGLVGDSHLWGEMNFGAYAAKRLGCSIVGEGVKGAKTHEILAQTSAVADADVIVVSAGSNDLANAPWEGIEAVGKFYPRILSALRGKRIFCSTIIPLQNGHEDHCVRAINWVIKREATRAGAAIFDAYQFYTGPHGLGRSAYDYSDMVHLSERGSAFLGSLLAYQIENPMPDEMAASRSVESALVEAYSRAPGSAYPSV